MKGIGTRIRTKFASLSKPSMCKATASNFFHSFFFCLSAFSCIPPLVLCFLVCLDCTLLFLSTFLSTSVVAPTIQLLWNVCQHVLAKKCHSPVLYCAHRVGIKKRTLFEQFVDVLRCGDGLPLLKEHSPHSFFLLQWKQFGLFVFYKVLLSYALFALRSQKEMRRALSTTQQQQQKRPIVEKQAVMEARAPPCVFQVQLDSTRWFAQVCIWWRVPQKVGSFRCLFVGVTWRSSHDRSSLNWSHTHTTFELLFCCCCRMRLLFCIAPFVLGLCFYPRFL